MDDGDVPNFKTLQAFIRISDVEYDLEKEMMMQRVALQMTKLQTVTGLSLEDFAKEVDLKSSNLSRLQSGDHNPTILTLLDLAYRCGYDVEVKSKKRKKLPK